MPRPEKPDQYNEPPEYRGEQLETSKMAVTAPVCVFFPVFPLVFPRKVCYVLCD